MVELDVFKINESSPYKVEQVAEGEFAFKTDYNVEYVVCFELDDILLKNETYQFSIINRNSKKIAFRQQTTPNYNRNNLRVLFLQ